MVVLLDPDSATFKQWGGVALPTTFILDASGRIRYEAFGPVNRDAPHIIEMITQLMNTNTSETGKADK